MSSMNNMSSSHANEKHFFRTFGRRDSSETLKERARAGKLKTPSSSSGKPPVQALSSEPLSSSRTPSKIPRARGNRDSLGSRTSSNAAVLAAASSEDDEFETVRVAVRLRPLNPLEVLASKRNLPLISSTPKSNDDAYDSFKAWNVETMDGRDVLVQKGSGRKAEGKNMFSFDGVFQEDHSTSYVYDNFARPIVRAVLTGKHGTIFTYGTSGSGKTHSMQGNGKNGSLHQDGIIQLAVRDLFNHIKKDSGKREYVMRISFFEIYNEQVRDLLSANHHHHRSPSKSYMARQSPSKTTKSSPAVKGSRFTFEGVSSGSHSVNNNANNNTNTPQTTKTTAGMAPDSEKKQVSSVDDVLKLLNAGNLNRAVATTILNDASSRSHAIFRLTIESRERKRPDHRYHKTSESDHIVRISALNFVDLAGSENTTKAATVGSRRRESGKINQSLLSLSQVIHALSLPSKKRPKFINYRNSKLTRILQPHLSGNAVLAVLCCATPARANLEETRGTLKFGANAKRIQMKPVVNEIVDDKALIKKLQKDLKEAQEAIKTMEQQQKEPHSELEASNVALSVERAISPTSQGESPLPSSTFESTTSTPSPRSSSHSDPLTSTDENDNSLSEGCEQRTETPEKRQSATNLCRVEPSPLPSPTVTPERVASPNNLSCDNGKLYDISQLDAVLLENRFRSSDQDSKAERSVQQEDNSTLSDLSSRRPPTIRVVQDSPPSEVTIIRSPLSDIGEDVDINVRLNDAEERARFLEEKLEAADRLVELMTRDLRNARLCIHELVFRNVRLENQLVANNTSTTTVPSTVDVTEGREEPTMMTSERIGI
ncbi:Kinesin-like protein [Seminavis robusta]|uniref:Kinesin-like protein n=1 Tax=Seminavis robusta TaxID=568900 RepID=A0A9N8DGZ6_9STRA|nr:Kinesin-like protein [Seminavis robusta]|eukprot:Sro84_g044990.1 Kinesin-like protein (827) ;mRNA; f:95105-97803